MAEKRKWRGENQFAGSDFVETNKIKCNESSVNLKENEKECVLEYKKKKKKLSEESQLRAINFDYGGFRGF